MSFKLGFFLAQKEIVNLDLLERAFRRQLLLGGTLDTNLLEIGAISLEQLEQIFGEIFPKPSSWTYKNLQIPPTLLSEIPLPLIEKFQIVPIKLDGQTLEILAADPTTPMEFTPLAYLLNKTLEVHIIPQIRLFQALHTFYGYPLPHRLHALIERLSLNTPFTSFSSSSSPIPSKTLPIEPHEAPAIQLPAKKQAVSLEISQQKPTIPPPNKLSAPPTPPAEKPSPTSATEKSSTHLSTQNSSPSTPPSQSPSPSTSHDKSIPSAKKTQEPRLLMTSATSQPPKTEEPKLALPPVSTLREAFRRPRREKIKQELEKEKEAQKKIEEEKEKEKETQKKIEEEKEKEKETQKKIEENSKKEAKKPLSEEIRKEIAEKARKIALENRKKKEAEEKASSSKATEKSSDKSQTPFLTTQSSPSQESFTSTSPKNNETSSEKKRESSHLPPIYPSTAKQEEKSVQKTDEIEKINLSPAIPENNLPPYSQETARTIQGLPAFSDEITHFDDEEDDEEFDELESHSIEIEIDIDDNFTSSPSKTQLHPQKPSSFENDFQEYLMTKSLAQRRELLQKLLPVGDALIPIILTQIPPQDEIINRNADLTEIIRRIVHLCEMSTPSLLNSLIKIIQEQDHDSRHRAAILIGRCSSSKVIPPLIQTLLSEEDPQMRSILRKILMSYRDKEEFVKLLQFLRSNLRSNDLERLRKTIHLLQDLRIVEAMPDLLSLLSHPSPDLKQSVLQALRRISLQDFGNELTLWNQWLSANSHLDRKHWIVDSMNHPQLEIREFVKEDLQEEFGDDFNYDPHSTDSERERIRKLVSLWIQKK